SLWVFLSAEKAAELTGGLAEIFAVRRNCRLGAVRKTACETSDHSPNVRNNLRIRSSALNPERYASASCRFGQVSLGRGTLAAQMRDHLEIQFIVGRYRAIPCHRANRRHDH